MSLTSEWLSDMIEAAENQVEALPPGWAESTIFGRDLFDPTDPTGPVLTDARLTQENN